MILKHFVNFFKRSGKKGGKKTKKGRKRWEKGMNNMKRRQKGSGKRIYDFRLGMGRISSPMTLYTSDELFIILIHQILLRASTYFVLKKMCRDLM